VQNRSAPRDQKSAEVPREARTLAREKDSELEARPQAATTKALPWASNEFAAIYQEHSQTIYYLALRLLGDPAQAEDATHDVFLKAYRKMSQFRGDSGVRTWLYRITINHCQNLSQTWHRRHIFSNADEAVWETAATNADTPLRVLEIKELGQRIQKTLDRLPKEYRLLLLLVADEKLSYQEIGALTDQTADAVRGKLHRARKAFAAAFNQTA
jgi:RNA polymerase sigma-70 factor (ECF subfamily)